MRTAGDFGRPRLHRKGGAERRFVGKEGQKGGQKAFEYQRQGKGFTLVEMLSSCPTNWKMTPDKALEYVKNDMQKIFPLGVFKEVE